MRRVTGAAPVGRLLVDAYAAGRAVRVVTGGRDRAGALDAFAVGLGLPNWFGRNLDALADALRDLADEEGRPVELIWDGAGAIARADPRSYAALLAVLADAERPDLHVTVVEGPA